MTVQVWHLNCAYTTPQGDAICRAIVPGEARLERTVTTKTDDDLPPGEVFTVKLDDPNVAEVFCFITGSAI